MKPSKCNHPEDKVVIAVVEVVCTCETTALYCTECNNFLTEPETDCI